MKTEERKVFIINCMYSVILLAAAFVILKYGLPMVTPFVTVSVIVHLLKEPVCFLPGRSHLNQKVTAILLVPLSCNTTGLLITLFCTKMFSQGKVLIVSLLAIYTNRTESVLAGIFSSIEQSILRTDSSLVGALEEPEGHFVQSVDQMASGLSISTMGWIPGFASSLPGLFINLLPMAITTFLIVVDYDRLTSFCLLQTGEKSRGIFLKIQAYVIGMLFVRIRSYVLIISITFVEFALGLTLISVEHFLPTAFLIVVFDIPPVLETGGIVIPWMIIIVTMRDHRLALGFLTVYLAITVIRNIIEPRTVGNQIGLHPVMTLVSMFVEAQLFGVLGLFGFPIGLSLLCHLNDTGTVRLLRTV